MRMRWLNRRVIVRASILLLLGAIINVAVAWGCAFAGTGALGLGLSDQHEKDLEWWSHHAPVGWEDKFGLSSKAWGLGFEWTWLGSDPSLEGGHVEFFRVESGLPFKSMTGDVWYTTTYDDGSGEFKEHVEFEPNGPWLRTESLDGVSITWYLPLRPLWWGFLLDSILYSGVAWLCTLSLTAPRVLRAWRRKRHGRCVACGYDLRGATTAICPECGHGR